MTREQAKREIDFLDYYLQNHTDDYGEESHTAMMMAIQALEQQSSGSEIPNNCEMRDATLEERESIDKYIKSISKPTGVKFGALEQEPCEDVVSCKALISHIENQIREWGEDYDAQQILGDIEDMPSVKPQEPKWIPVSEKLPEEETAVLISCEDLYLHRLNPCIGWRYGQYWNTFTANGCKQILYPTAWMPLPKPYEPQERSE